MNKPRRPAGAAASLKAVRGGDRLALARAITEVENRSVVGLELGQAALDLRANTRTLGITGPPGAGKSSLINALIAELLPNYPRIGILTVDPSSPVSGGAVLGDRVRMAAHSANPDIFIRSLASRGHLGGVTRTTRSVIALLAAAQMDLVIVETVGTGQSEVEVAELTHVKLVVSAPGMGDEMQAIKAGVLEIADLLVINKADLPDADRTANHLKSMLMHRGHDERRVALKVSAAKGDGLTALADAIHARLEASVEGKTEGDTEVGNLRITLAQDLSDLVAAMLRESADPRIEALVQEISDGTVERHRAAREALRILAEHEEASGAIAQPATYEDQERMV